MRVTDECKFLSFHKKDCNVILICTNRFVGVFALLHIMVFGFGLIHYTMKVKSDITLNKHAYCTNSTI